MHMYEIQTNIAFSPGGLARTVITTVHNPFFPLNSEMCERFRERFRENILYFDSLSELSNKTFLRYIFSLFILVSWIFMDYKEERTQ